MPKGKKIDQAEVPPIQAEEPKLKFRVDVAVAMKSGAGFPLFRAKVERNDGGELPSVSLSRKGDSCFFTLDNFQDHYGHTPPMSDAPSCDTYISRVIEAIGGAFIGRGLGDGLTKVEPPEKTEDGWSTVIRYDGPPFSEKGADDPTVQIAKLGDTEIKSTVSEAFQSAFSGKLDPAKPSDGEDEDEGDEDSDEEGEEDED